MQHLEIDDAELAEATGRYFKLGADHLTPVDDLAETYRRHRTAAVVFTYEITVWSGCAAVNFPKSSAGQLSANEQLAFMSGMKTRLWGESILAVSPMK